VKDKAEVLKDVESLTQIKNELTGQLAEMTTELEKERSKVHQLQIELTKHGVSFAKPLAPS